MNPALFASPPANACVPGAEGTGANAFGPDRITKNVYDLAGQRVQLRDGVGSAVEAAEATWAYTPTGQISAVIDGNGNRVTLTYDGHGRQDRWTFPSTTRPAAYDDSTQATALATAGTVNAGDYEAYTYDAAGNRLSLRKRDGSTLTYQYDNLNRMLVKVVPERTGLAALHTRDVYYGYDLRNLQLHARFDGHGGEGVTTTYDAFGRPATSTIDLGGVSRTLTYGHDAAGNRTQLLHPDQALFQTWFDPAGRPYYLFHSGWVGIAYANYSPAGLPSQMAHGAYTNWSYDAVQRPTGLSHGLNASPGAVSWTQGYNPAGQVTTTSRDNDAFAWTGHYAVNRGYTTNGLNQYSQAGGTALTYDANGNLATETTGTAPNQLVTTYSYDVENRLVGISGARTAALTYDPLGRLHTVAGTGPAATFLYDGDALVVEYNANGTVARRHAHWPGADVPMATYEGPGWSTPRFLFSDRQGSVIARADDNALNVEVNSYDEYGIPDASNAGRFQYTGQAWLSELGMYYYKARVYSPTLGRFLQTDPIGYEGGVNLYAYVADDPVNRLDPSGNGPEIVGCAAFGPAAPACAAVDLIGTGLVILFGGAAVLSSPSRPSRDAPASDRAVSSRDNGGPELDPDDGPNPIFVGAAIALQARIGARVSTLNRSHYRAVRREGRGEVVARRPSDGRPFDHVNEVREELAGLRNDLSRLQRLVNSGRLTSQQASLARGAIARGQRLYNEGRAALQRGCTGTRICSPN